MLLHAISACIYSIFLYFGSNYIGLEKQVFYSYHLKHRIVFLMSIPRLLRTMDKRDKLFENKSQCIKRIQKLGVATWLQYLLLCYKRPLINVFVYFQKKRSTLALRTRSRNHWTIFRRISRSDRTSPWGSPSCRRTALRPSTPTFSRNSSKKNLAKIESVSQIWANLTCHVVLVPILQNF